MSRTIMKRLERLEQSAGEKKPARMLVVSDFSEVPAGIDPGTLVIRTGVPRSQRNGG
ncbi:hypothetical protein [Microvirga vignae]|uniref:hypothetical protein n=1 Tax=Microvirga vignae TaxID=1225564 RepID=UPI001364D9AC|nr:hypothetical protein [Microvirga vignae]